MGSNLQQIGILTNTVVLAVMQSGLSSGQQYGADEVWICLQMIIIKCNCVATILTSYILRHLNRTQQACQNCCTVLTYPLCFLLSSEIMHPDVCIIFKVFFLASPCQSTHSSLYKILIPCCLHSSFFTLVLSSLSLCGNILLTISSVWFSYIGLVYSRFLCAQQSLVGLLSNFFNRHISVNSSKKILNHRTNNHSYKILYFLDLQFRQRQHNVHIEREVKNGTSGLKMEGKYGFYCLVS